MTSIYSAIMKAADHIESHPQEFNIMAIGVPTPGCGSPGCALGWISHFMGIARSNGCYNDEVTMRALGVVHADSFYYRMQEANGEGLNRGEFGRWSKDAISCARVLRLYAEKYHADEKPKVPDWNVIASKQTVDDDARSQEVAA